MMVIAGMIIGSGIFSTPSGILTSVGSVGMSLIIWVIAALASVCGVLAYIELGSVSDGRDWTLWAIGSAIATRVD
jgi:solute carrier family 7 (L-type amino acid transporter), member 9/15